MCRLFVLPLKIAVASVMLLGSTFAQQSSAPSTQQPPVAKSGQTPAAQSQNNPALPTQKDKLSYAIGMNIGKGLHRESIDVDPAIILRGMQDAMVGGKTLLTDEEAQATITQLQNEIRQKVEAKAQAAAEANKKEGDAFQAANKAKPGVITLPSGLQYKILKEGTGAKPMPTDSVVCDYRGTLIDGKEFDSSYKRGQPATFPVNGVIKGWTEALQLMPVGSQWQLVVPPELAYGVRGAGADIGPNSTLIFEVDLHSIQAKSQ
jgi:FKBP-type peptidyl-prolyl cis-trans isomerase FklB